MSRSNFKGPFIDYKLLKLAISSKKKKIKHIYTRSRSSIITFDLLGLIVHVYNGKIYYPIYIKEYMLGYKSGSFSFTKKKAIFKKKKKK